jgi:hypothetical protein
MWGFGKVGWMGGLECGLGNGGFLGEGLGCQTFLGVCVNSI